MPEFRQSDAITEEENEDDVENESHNLKHRSTRSSGGVRTGISNSEAMDEGWLPPPPPLSKSICFFFEANVPGPSLAEVEESQNDREEIERKMLEERSTRRSEVDGGDVGRRSGKAEAEVVETVAEQLPPQPPPPAAKPLKRLKNLAPVEGKRTGKGGPTVDLFQEQGCRRFAFAEIQSATHNFDDALIIGQGGFGKVYKGVIDEGASIVAVKRLNPTSRQGVTEFRTEIDMLSKFRHCYLVSLIGYCDDSDEMILVYEYMIRGTLADHLHKKVGKDSNSPLTWVRRLKICIGAARGLDYLHTGTGVLHTVIHRDVKSSNILLDENWAAKISDFGLSKVGSTNHGWTDVSTNVKGTFGYLDPEYLLTLRLTRKSDVYSFGVVLMEVLCGRPAVDPRLEWEQRSLARWAQQCIKEKRVSQIIDPNLKWEILSNSLTTFVELADQCLHNCPKKRPTMSGVVTRLEHALAFQERPDSSSVIEMEFFNDGWDYTNEESTDGGQHDGQNDATISLDNEIEKQAYNQLEVTMHGGQNYSTTISLEDESEELVYNQLEVIHGDNNGQNDAAISLDDESKEEAY